MANKMFFRLYIYMNISYPIFVENSNYSKLRCNSGISYTSKNNLGVLDFGKDDFFVKIKGYGKNEDWAREIIRAADNAVNLIKLRNSAETVLINIADGVRKANLFTGDLAKQKLTGLLRAQRSGWNSSSALSDLLITKYSSAQNCRYKVYYNRLNEVYLNPLWNPYYNFGLTVVEHKKDVKYLAHAESIYVNNAMDRVGTLYYKIINNFLGKPLSKDNMENLHASIAEIRWILAHSTPWERGSDAISNVFMRSIYKALGIKMSPLKQNVSLDLEAYCTNLSDYKVKFADYFEKSPQIV